MTDFDHCSYICTCTGTCHLRSATCITATGRRVNNTVPVHVKLQPIVLVRGVSGCLLDTLFQFWTPYFICHLHVKVL